MSRLAKLSTVGITALFLSIIAVLNVRQLEVQLQRPSGFRVPDEHVQSTDSAPLRRYTAALGRELAHLSPFDTAVGDLMGGIIPVADVSAEERTRFRRLWERVFAPDLSPQEDAGIEWRKLLRSQVRWQESDGRGKHPDPNPFDNYIARWFIDGIPIVVAGEWYPNNLEVIGITISLTGDDRLRCRYPRLRDLGPKDPRPIIVSEIDKARLLEILTTELRFPWQTVDDFVVTWWPSPTSAGHLRIKSSGGRPQSEGGDWFDDVSLRVVHGDPQEVSISAVFFVDRSVGAPADALFGNRRLSSTPGAIGCLPQATLRAASACATGFPGGVMGLGICVED